MDHWAIYPTPGQAFPRQSGISLQHADDVDEVND